MRLEGSVESGWLRIAVADDPGSDDSGAAALAGPLTPGPSRNGDPRHGHGLAVCARIASAHGGRLALSRQGAGTRAVLVLPLALDSAHRGIRDRPSLAA